MDYTERLQGIIEGFVYELCHECGEDIDRHLLGPDVLGNPQALCLTEV